MKRIQVTPEQIDQVLQGNDLVLNLSPKRSLAIGFKSDKEIKKDCLKAKFEAQLAKLEGESNDV